MPEIPQLINMYTSLNEAGRARFFSLMCRMTTSFPSKPKRPSLTLVK